MGKRNSNPVKAPSQRLATSALRQAQQAAKGDLTRAATPKLLEWHSVLLNEVLVLRAMQQATVMRREGRQLAISLERVVEELTRRGHSAHSVIPPHNDSQGEEKPRVITSR